MAINLEKGTTPTNTKKLMKRIFDNIIEKEVSSLNDIVKEMCSYEDIVITDLDSSTALLKNKKQVFIYFYSTNIPEYKMVMTITTHEEDDNVVVESMKISDVNEKAYMVTF